MSDLPTSPDLQAEAERVFADVQREVLVEDAVQVILRALRARDERAAKAVDAECQRILSKQDGKDYSIDLNLRLMACILPDLATSIRGA